MMPAKLQLFQQLVTMLFIASSAGVKMASAQNDFQIPNNLAAEHVERERIAHEREVLKKSLVQKRETCYQRLAVTPCLNDARDEYNEKTLDLKRQEMLLNDAQRKRAASARVNSIDERNSPAAQLARAQNRGRALEATARREESQTQRQNNREQKQSGPATKFNQADDPALNRDRQRLAPKGIEREQPVAKATPEQRPSQAQRLLNKAHRSAERDKEAILRRNKMAEREASRKKPPSAGLPIPLL